MKRKLLAINGGERIIKTPLARYNSIGNEEVYAASQVIKSGVLSKYIGADSEDFFGGPKVKEFEKLCCDYFRVKHAITVNSWTSGLIAAVGALNINPGDEIIVPTWTMCASATAILHWNAIPVFADIEKETFNIDPISIVRNISKRTKAIMAVDIFGHSCDMSALKKIAKENNLKIISDAAQSPGAIYQGEFAGTLSDIGGFSLNYHKHIHTGEGGILVTNDDDLALRMQLIRNHAEAAVNGMKISNISNMVGYNFRLGEIECAIGIEQLKKLKTFISSRIEAAEIISNGIRDLQGLRIPTVKKGSSHVYYVYPMLLDTDQIGVSRRVIIEAMQAEGLDGLMDGYANIHMQPIYQKKIAYGERGFPWSSDICDREINYEKGICPVAEDLHERSFLGYQMCLHELSINDAKKIVAVFQKVWKNLDELK